MMIGCLALLAVVCGHYAQPSTCQAAPDNTALLQEWGYFKTTHSKVYPNPTVELFRRHIWRENVNKIAEHNLHYYRANITFRLSMNAYGDMLSREFLASHSGTYRTKRRFITGNNSDPSAGLLHGFRNVLAESASGASNSSLLGAASLPPFVDWRQKGAVTPVKRQGECGSCWAFAVTGSLEGQHFLRTGKLVSLSEQNLLDCVSKDDSDSCLGGVLDDAYIYVRNNGGIDTEESYPYEAKRGNCRYDPKHKAANDVGFRDIPDGDEEALKVAVALVGPVSVGIDASHPKFQFYSDGIYEEAGCVEENLNHGVLVVGYGTSHGGQDYWLLKNSWGREWGEGGYFYIARNKNNMCGITAEASYPIVQ